MLWSGFRIMPEKKESLYYLLSAQAETLGTLFVLAFTFTLVAAQSRLVYSHIMLGRVIGALGIVVRWPFRSEYHTAALLVARRVLLVVSPSQPTISQLLRAFVAALCGRCAKTVVDFRGNVRHQKGARNRR